MTDPSLKNRLLALQPPNPAREQLLKQEIAAMWNHTLTRAHRFYWGLSLFGALFGGTVGILAAVIGTMDPWIRIIWWLFAAANLAAALFTLRVLRRGAVDFRNQISLGKASSGITFAIAALLVMRTIANPSLVSLGWALFGVVWLLLALTINLWNRIIQAETATREQLLRLELRLTEGASPKA